MLKAPHQKLLEKCRKNGALSAWAIGSGTTKKGTFCWEVFLENKQEIKKLPKKFEGEPVYAIVCKKPTM